MCVSVTIVSCLVCLLTVAVTGGIKLLYVTPEFMTSTAAQELLGSLHRRSELSLIAVDECHCISSWVRGHRIYAHLSHHHLMRFTGPRFPTELQTSGHH